jgi:putative transposase
MDPVQVRRGYKFCAYLAQPQQRRSARLLVDHCDLYNAALEERREAWRKRTAGISYSSQPAHLREIRACDRDGQGRHSVIALQRTLRPQNVFFQAFYGRCRAGRQPGYPRFKPHSRFEVMAGTHLYRRMPARSWARRAALCAQRDPQSARQAAS